MLKPFDFQEIPISLCLERLDKPKSDPGLIVCPVGYGKSIIIGSIANYFSGNVLVLQPNVELVRQNLSKLIGVGGEGTIFSASAGEKNVSHTTFATLGSVVNSLELFKDVELVIIDECDAGYDPQPGSMFRRVMDYIKPKHVIGLTATPMRMHNSMDGATLKILTRTRPKYFKDFIYVMQIQEIIDKGRWTPIKYETYEFDEKGLILNSNGSDYTEDSIRVFNELNGINSKMYKRICDLQSDGVDSILVFCDSIETADNMSAKTPKSAVVSANTSKKERDTIVKNFLSGEIQVVYNYGTLLAGFDYPALKVVIFGRPTGSFRIYYQGLGRGVRLHESKPDFKFIDFGNNVKRFGKVEDVVIEDCEYNGWSVYCDDRLITGVPLNGVSITKEDLKGRKIAKDNQSKSLPSEDYTINFGKHKGSKLKDIPANYLNWLYDSLDPEKFNNGILKEHIGKYLKAVKVNQL